MSKKLNEEIIEREFWDKSQQIISQNLPQLETFQKLVLLYNQQPVLNTRTSTSVRYQAYSTPFPLAYLLSCLVGINNKTTVYEPSAGNAALLIAANPELVTANELEPTRLEHLKSKGYITSGFDATVYNPRNTFDVVIGNPPFGSTTTDKGVKKSFRYSGYQTEQLDYAIAWQSLKFMKPEGSAGFVLGGKLGDEPRRLVSYGQKSSRNFFYYLYNNYNVTTHISLAGKLYAKQGARFPIDLIVVKGKGKSELELPFIEIPVMYESFESLEQFFNPQGKYDEQK